MDSFSNLTKLYYLFILTFGSVRLRFKQKYPPPTDGIWNIYETTNFFGIANYFARKFFSESSFSSSPTYAKDMMGPVIPTTIFPTIKRHASLGVANDICTKFSPWLWIKACEIGVITSLLVRSMNSITLPSICAIIHGEYEYEKDDCFTPKNWEKAQQTTPPPFLKVIQYGKTTNW